MCRRALLLSFLKEYCEPFKKPHMCCDVCKKTCSCDNCVNTVEAQPEPVATKTKVRDSSEEENDVFKACLVSSNSRSRSVGVFGLTDTLILSSAQIEELSKHLNFIDSVEYIETNFSLPLPIAVDVIDIINEIFSENIVNVSIDFEQMNIDDVLSLDVPDQIEEDSEPEENWQDLLDHI